MGFWAEYGTPLIFYAIVFSLIYFNRKKFDFQAKVIAIYRTKIGLKTMKWCGEKLGGLIRAVSMIGVVVGFAGMALALYTIIDGLILLITTPSAPATMAPIVPGVKIPGSPIFVPFWYGIIALFVSVVIHEFSHGIVAAANKLKIKSSGFAMFAILPAAFVEFDEKKLRSKAKQNLAVSAAGPFSNILLTLLLVVFFGFTPGLAQGIDNQFGTQIYSEGLVNFNDKISISNYAAFEEQAYRKAGMYMLAQEGQAADLAGMPNTTVLITSINGINATEDYDAFEHKITTLTPGETITLSNGTANWTFAVGTNEENTSKGRIGVLTQTYVTENEAYKNQLGAWYPIKKAFFTQIFWIFILSLGLGIANLLPLGPVDGGRMFLVVLEKIIPNKKLAQKIWTQVSLFIFIAILILILTPIIKAVLHL